VGDIEPKDVLADMRQRLPRYMLPNLVEPLETMPLTSNAKLDRVALKAYTEQRKKDKQNG
jgi:acyl-CoA synthetase (AMP-forming)/AMP-acid ligase II